MGLISMLILAQAGDPAGWPNAELLSDRGIRLAAAIYGGLLLLGLAADVKVWLHCRREPLRWAARMRRMVGRAWSGSDLAALLIPLMALFLMVALFHAWLLDTRGEDTLDQWATFLTILQTLAFHWAIIGIAAIILLSHGRRWREVFGMDVGQWGRWIREGASGYLAMFPVFAAYAALYQFALRAVGYQPPLQEVVHTIAAEDQILARLYLLLVAVLIAPIAEELLFRGVAFPWLTKMAGVGPAMLIVSLAFAGIHLHVGSFVPLFVVSLALCVAYAYSGSLFVPIIMHGLFNAVNLSMLEVLH